MHGIIKAGLVLFVLATPVKWVVNGLGDKTRYAHPCSSPTEARFWGVYAGSVQVLPEAISYHGQEIKFGEAWVERQNNQRYFLVWFPYRKKMDGYHLCFTLRQGKEVLKLGLPPLFVNGDAGHSFGTNGSLFYETLEDLPPCLKVSLVESFQQTRAKNIGFRIDPKTK